MRNFSYKVNFFHPPKIVQDGPIKVGFSDHVFNINIFKKRSSIKKMPLLNAQVFIRGQFFFVPPKIVEDGPNKGYFWDHALFMKI